jgi:outer membrane protein
MPKYAGAADYQALPVPLLDFKKGVFFGLSTGLVAQFDPGRDANDSRAQSGGDILRAAQPLLPSHPVS